MRIFSIYDSKAEAYIQPFFTHNKATAIRSFTQAAQDENSQFSQHAADYTLMQIGEWNETTGEIVADETKTNLGTALEHGAKPQISEVTEIHQPITSGRKG